jgi:beta-glucosidase
MTEPLSFRDPDLPLPERVADLLGRLTLAEKVALLHQHQPAIPRLGLEGFRTGTEALHGVAWLGPATVFPQAIGLATTWHPDLLRAVGQAVGTEVQAFHLEDPAHAGLNVWAPVVNPLRDPRWGRNEEGYAEDPWLTGVIATAYAGGLGGDDPRRLLTAPTLKHFLAYNNESDRHTSSSNLPPRVLHEYELPAFRAPIEAGAAVAVMLSYNLVNGRPAHLSPLVNDVVRQWTDDEILVVSDAGAPGCLVDPQRYYDDPVEAYAAAVRAGLDSFTQDDADAGPTIKLLTEALDRGVLAESDVDSAVRRILTIRARLGDFDPVQPAAAMDVVNCAAHRELAREAARQSIVLLKDECHVLPLPEACRVAVVGPLADVLYEDWYSGTLPYAVTARDGLAARLGPDRVTHCAGVDRVALRVAGDGRYVTAPAGPTGGPLRTAPTDASGGFDVFDWGRDIRALRAAANGRHVSVNSDGVLVNDQPGPNGWIVRETFRFVEHSDGAVALHHQASGRYVVVGADGTLRAEAPDLGTATALTVELVLGGGAAAAAAARDADVAVVVVGNHPMVNGRETQDRVDLSLPPAQEELIRAVHEANPHTVLVVTSGYPYAITWAQENLPAILWSAHGGQEHGHALADILLGDVDPAGRLTQTWYRSAIELPDLEDYDIVATDATYLYYRGTPLYPFGHGHSYTTFEYRNLRLSADTIGPDGTVTVSVDVTNTGARAGVEVVQLYTHQQRSRVKQPLRQLRGFSRVRLEPGATTTVTMPLRAADLAFWDVTRRRPVVEAARHKVLVGRSSTDIAQTATLTVRGERIPPRDPFAGPLWAIDHDDYAGVVLLDETRTAGDAVAAEEAGAWVAFEGVDFSGPVARWRARVARPAESGPDAGADAGTAAVTLRLDDPLAGPVVGSADVPHTGGRYSWADVGGSIGSADGVRDLYLVFEVAGILVSRLTFEGP